MRKNRIRLTESQLHRVITESVKKVLRESSDSVAPQPFGRPEDSYGERPLRNIQSLVDKCDNALVKLHQFLAQNNSKYYTVSEIMYKKEDYNTPYFIYNGYPDFGLYRAVRKFDIRNFLDIQQAGAKRYVVTSNSGMIKFDEEYNSDYDDDNEPPTYQAMLRSGHDFDHSTM